MASQPPAAVGTRGNKRVLVVVGIVAIAALVGGWVYLRVSGHNTAGLEGTWREVGENSRHCYEFQRNGDLACWYGPKSWWNRIGWSATWWRDGNQITIHTDRNWDFEGQLDGETIRGRMLIRDQPGGKVVTTQDVVWQKE
jgi:hypothetical protein